MNCLISTENRISITACAAPAPTALAKSQPQLYHSASILSNAMLETGIDVSVETAYNTLKENGWFRPDDPGKSTLQMSRLRWLVREALKRNLVHRNWGTVSDSDDDDKIGISVPWPGEEHLDIHNSESCDRYAVEFLSRRFPSAEEPCLSPFERHLKVDQHFMLVRVDGDADVRLWMVASAFFPSDITLQYPSLSQHLGIDENTEVGREIPVRADAYDSEEFRYYGSETYSLPRWLKSAGGESSHVTFQGIHLPEGESRGWEIAGLKFHLGTGKKRDSFLDKIVNSRDLSLLPYRINAPK